MNADLNYNKLAVELMPSENSSISPRQELEIKLVRLVEKIHNDLGAEYDKKIANYNQERDRERVLLSNSIQETIKKVKEKTWCRVCFHEANYFCCWNTSYCNVTCQEIDWPKHEEFCRR